MSIPSTKDLSALGLAPAMLGEAEHLALPEPSIELARGVPRGGSDVHDLVDARSDVLHALGIELRFDRGDRALQFEWIDEMAVRVRDAHPSARPYPEGDPGALRLPLRQLGRFLVESPGGVPLALGIVESATLTLVAVGAWPVPPLEDWNLPMIDTWLQSMVDRTLPDADTWTRVTLAGVITRLSDPLADLSARPAPGGGAPALLAQVSRSPAMRPRMWARSLDRASLAAIEEHARRRAVALEDDLEDLLAVMPLDDEDARDTWTRLCHRRDDIEGVRVLLLEAGGAGALDDALLSTDRAGRSMRVNLGADVATDDERLRRVALGDPGAWWGEPGYEVRLL